MDILTFISSLAEHLAWPITCAAIVFVLRRHLVALLARIISIKHGDMELSFARSSEELLTQSMSPEKRQKIRSQQVITSHKWETGYYTLYSNGVIVQRFRVRILSGQKETRAVFPIAFPNEITGIEFIGNTPPYLVEIGSANMLIAHPVSHADREFDIIVSGL